MYSVTEVDFDGETLVMLTRSRLPAAKRCVFAGINSLVTLFFLSVIASTGSSGAVVGGLLVIGLFAGIPWLLWAWNAYGRERIIMTRKSVVRQKHYGLFETKPVVTVFGEQDVLLTFKEHHTRRQTRFGSIIWAVRHPDTDLFEPFFETAIPVAEPTFITVKDRVQVLLRTRLEEFLLRSQN